MDVDKVEGDADASALPPKEVLMEFPHPRFNAQLAVQGDQLFIYGGTFSSNTFILSNYDMHNGNVHD